ncbi:MAG: outer membrane protein assembly factor BamC, partial [Arsenophonus sp. ET-DL12-MAG3]
MIKLLNKLKFSKFKKLLLVIFLTACIDNQHYKRQIISNESYLNTPSLKKLIIPKGILLPLRNIEYDILLVNQDGPIGKALDIRPPIQILSLFINSYLYNSLTESRLFLNKKVEKNTIWQIINIILQQKMIKIKYKNNFDYSLITDWITWPKRNKDIFLQTRQKIRLNSRNNQTIITVSNEGIKHGKKNIADPVEIQRY